MTPPDPFREAAMKAAHRIATELYGSAGGNYSLDAEIIFSEFSTLRAEHQRLREACEAVSRAEKSMLDTRAKRRAEAVEKCRAALEPRKGE